MKRDRVLVVSGQSLFSVGIRKVLTDGDLSLVGEAGSPMEAAVKVSALAPDIVILDSPLPTGNARNAMKLLGTVDPRISIIFLSDRTDEAYVEQVLMCGASAYVLKKHAATDLRWALKAAQKGREYFSPALVQELRAPGAAIPEPDQNFQIEQLDTGPVEARLAALLGQALLIRRLAQDLQASIKAIRLQHPDIAHKYGHADVAGWFRRRILKVLPILRVKRATSG